LSASETGDSLLATEIEKRGPFLNTARIVEVLQLGDHFRREILERTSDDTLTLMDLEVDVCVVPLRYQTAEVLAGSDAVTDRHSDIVPCDLIRDRAVNLKVVLRTGPGAGVLKHDAVGRPWEPYSRVQVNRGDESVADTEEAPTRRSSDIDPVMSLGTHTHIGAHKDDDRWVNRHRGHHLRGRQCWGGSWSRADWVRRTVAVRTATTASA